MANSNVSVANRLFAYIKYKEDVTDSIVDQYKQSLIFMGDEQQIYAPSVNAYVGIGMTAYNNTLQKIDNLQTKIDEAAAAVKGQVVSSIYPNMIPEDIQRGKVSGTSTASYLVSTVGIIGINDYNPSTHEATNVRTVQSSYNASTGEIGLAQYTFVPGQIGYNNSNVTGGKPTSGINVRYQQKTRVVNGDTIQEENVLYIDDSATWEYIAYNSEVQYASTKKYIDSEINKVYHDLLGDTLSYVPASWDNVFDSTATIDGHDNTPVHTIDTGVDYWYKVAATQNEAAGTTVRTSDGQEVYFKWQKATFDSNGQLETTGDLVDTYPGKESFPQLYVQSGGSYAYNMSIKDGINTLKEVAYLLDILSDGTLGSVSYITYYDYTQLGSRDGWTVIADAQQDVNSIEPYAYKVTEGSAEDLGIKMAYSIAGNKLEIDHLHEHIRKAENGYTTVRSINSSYNSSLGYLNIINGALPTNTYFNELSGSNLPKGWVGDPTIALNLVLTNTYLSINQESWAAANQTAPMAVVNAGFGKEYYGEYLKVEPSEIDTNAARLQSGENKINVYVVTGKTLEEIKAFSASSWTQYLATEEQLKDIEAIKNGASATEGTYYFIKTKPDYVRGAFDNITWIKVSKDDVLNDVYADKNQYSDYYHTTASNSYETWGAPAWDKAAMLNPSNSVDWTNVYVYKLSDVKAYELKPIIYSSTNAIATADWVSSYISQEINKVNASQSNFESNIESLINNKLNNLDYEYKYSDFETIFWNDYVASLSSTANALTPGSTAYWQEYNRYYDSWKNQINDPTSIINQAYQTLKEKNSDYAIGGDDELLKTLVRTTYNSTAIVNVKQEDGKVTAEARELPTDKVNVNVDTWGETSSLDAKPIYELLSNCTREDVKTSINSLTTQQTLTGHAADILYNIKTLVNELYVPTNVEQFEAVRDGENVSSAALYLYNQATDSFIQDNNVSTATRAAILAGNHNYAGWKQYYKLVSSNKYIEVNVPATGYSDANGFSLSDIENNIHGPYTAATLVNNVYYIKGYVLANGTTILETDEDIATSATTNNVTVSEQLKAEVSSRRYLTAEFDHNSAANDGNGENTLHLTAHITKLEDATPLNSGFADAWDVKSYIDQLFTFVNISASIDAEILATRDAFYTTISYEEWSKVAEADRETLYTKGQDGRYTTVSSPATAKYFNSNNNYAGAYNENVTGDTTIRFNRPGTTTGSIYSPATHDYFVRHENVYRNPLNLTLTNHGKTVQP